MYEYIQTVYRLYLFNEFCSNGNLRKLMDEKALVVSIDTLPSGFNEIEVDKIMNDIVTGYKTLSDCKIIHRDIKPENILIEGGHYKLADFGFARFVPK